MIDALDEAMRELMIRELPIRNNEVDIAFDQPRREWSARLSRPTLNFFLYDIRENIRLRNQSPTWHVTQQGNGTATQRPVGYRVDVHYMLSAWANDPMDEHSLLTRSLMVLFRTPALPESILPDVLLDQPNSITLLAGQPDSLTKPSDVWGVLDNEMRVSIPCVVTLVLNPFVEHTTPLVRTRELRIGQSANPPDKKLDTVQGRWAVGGIIHGPGKPLTPIKLRLVERGLDIPVEPNGAWKAGKLQEGEYTVEIRENGHTTRQQKIIVPSDSYDIEW